MNDCLKEEDFKKYEYYAELLAYDLLTAAPESEIIIVSGTLNYLIYNHKEVVSAFKIAIAKKISFRVIAGPIIMTDRTGNNFLINLWKEQKLNLYCSKVRRSLHYRIIQKEFCKKLRCESPHSINTNFEKRKLVQGAEGADFWAAKLKNDFNSIIQINHARLSFYPYHNLLFLTIDEMNDLINKFKKENLYKIDFMTAEKIKKLL